MCPVREDGLAIKQSYRHVGKRLALASTAKPEKVRPIQLFLKVAAPWGRGDLSAAASGYSISGFARGAIFCASTPLHSAGPAITSALSAEVDLEQGSWPAAGESPCARSAACRSPGGTDGCRWVR